MVFTYIRKLRRLNAYLQLTDIHSILLDGLCEKGHSLEASKLSRSMLERRIQLQAPYANKIVEHMKKS